MRTLVAFVGSRGFPLLMVQFWHFKHYIYIYIYIFYGILGFHLTSLFFCSFSLPFLIRQVEEASFRSHNLPKGKIGQIG